MTEYDRLPVTRDGIEIVRWTLVDEEGDPFVVAAGMLTVQIDGGPVTLEGALTKEGPYWPLTDTQDKPLTFRQDAIEAVEERVYAVRPRGTGTVTLLRRSG